MMEERTLVMPLPRYTHKHLNLLREMVTSEFKLRDQSSVLGLIWSFLNPLLMLTILYVVFRFRIGEQIENYTLYLLVGLVHYTHLSNCTVAAMRVFHDKRSLTTDTIFPKEILVVAAVLSRSIEFAISVFVCIAIALLTGIQPSWSFLLVVPAILVQTAFVLTLSLMLSFSYLYLKDIEHLYELFLRMLFFLTPIFYDLKFLGHGVVRTITLLNPLTYFIMFTRAAILGGGSLLPQLLASIVTTGVLLSMSFLAFKKFEPALAERV